MKVRILFKGRKVDGAHGKADGDYLYEVAHENLKVEELSFFSTNEEKKTITISSIPLANDGSCYQIKPDAGAFAENITKPGYNAVHVNLSFTYFRFFWDVLGWMTRPELDTLNIASPGEKAEGAILKTFTLKYEETSVTFNKDYEWRLQSFPCKFDTAGETLSIYVNPNIIKNIKEYSGLESPDDLIRAAVAIDWTDLYFTGKELRLKNLGNFLINYTNLNRGNKFYEHIKSELQTTYDQLAKKGLKKDKLFELVAKLISEAVSTPLKSLSLDPDTLVKNAVTSVSNQVEERYLRAPQLDPMGRICEEICLRLVPWLVDPSFQKLEELAAKIGLDNDYPATLTKLITNFMEYYLSQCAQSNQYPFKLKALTHDSTGRAERVKDKSNQSLKQLKEDVAGTSKRIAVELVRDELRRARSREITRIVGSNMSKLRGLGEELYRQWFDAAQSQLQGPLVKVLRDTIDPFLLTTNSADWNGDCNPKNSYAYKTSLALSLILNKKGHADIVEHVIRKLNIEGAALASLILQWGMARCYEHSVVTFEIAKAVMSAQPEMQGILGCIVRTGYFPGTVDHAFCVVGLVPKKIVKITVNNQDRLFWVIDEDWSAQGKVGFVCDPYLIMGNDFTVTSCVIGFFNGDDRFKPEKQKRLLDYSPDGVFPSP